MKITKYFICFMIFILVLAGCSAKKIKAYEAGNSSSKNKIHSSRLAIEEKIVDFFGGHWIFSVISDNTFQLKADRKTGSDIEEVEKEGRQKNDLKLKFNYELDNKLNLSFKSTGKSSTNEITGNFNGSFHFPFFGNPDNFKYSERNILGSLKFAAKDIQKVSPSLLFELHYLQNNFYDYIESEKVAHSNYARQHGAQSASITEINLINRFSFSAGWG